MDPALIKRLREQRKEVADLNARVRLYSLFAFIFVAVGAMLFAYVYFVVYGAASDWMSPASYALVIAPFVPATVFAVRARRTERRALSIMQDMRAATTAPRAQTQA